MIPCENRLVYLDFLRSLLILEIVGFWHIDDYAGDIFSSKTTELITIGVLNAFIFISSYILYLKYGNIKTISELKSFILKRIARIYPLYLFTLLLFYYFFHCTNFELISQIFLFNMFSNTSISTLWFIGLIFNFYMIFPLICYRTSLKKIITFSGLFLSVCLVLLFLTERIDKRIVLYYPSFIIGILYCRYESSFYFLEKENFIFILLVASILLLISSQHLNNAKISPLLLFLGGIFLIFPSLYFSKKSIPYLKSRILDFFYKISYASFCMYLLHRLIYSALLKIYHPSSNFYTLLFLYFVGIPLLLIISYKVQYYYGFLIKHINDRPTSPSTRGPKRGFSCG